ncbi:MAG TPA: T9SS type A sorting domain-containing protein [Chitinophagaceae bacterium]|nr:T9SS type A sorting domain-containing protein [Chitinophagaceae bacterium]
MKKFTLIVAFLGLVMGAKAQSFSSDKDTSKLGWIYPGYDIEPHVSFTNTTSGPISFNWRMTNLLKDDKWVFSGACDNVYCYTEEVAGLVDGKTTFTSNPVNAGEKLDFKMIFNGNDATSGTKALGTIEIWTGGEAAKKATFLATKGTTGIKTVLLKGNDDIVIFPNPASSYIDVIYSPASDVKTIAIYNLIGKAVNVYKVTDKSSARCEFSADMPSGIYIVRMADSKGNVIATRKITHQ